ncbi:MAG: phosphatidylinositol kinase [Gammaproteobacteria bacterium]|nr:MAG: phosphatidylinositol kinase [Gammaproteobacteria bacterium]
MFEIISIPDDAPVQFEQMGTKYKFWYTGSDGERTLFKQGRPNTGENWAEKVCCELCSLLDLPHAHYEFAKWKEVNGVATPTIVPNGARLVHGNELLAGVNKYEAGKQYKVRGHTVRLVLAVIGNPDFDPPIGCNVPGEFTSASDFFVGYLMLDAWVSNQDRHHENWGLVVSQDGGVTLAPTFDHAASLGRNESDETRLDRLRTKDKGRSVEAYVERARSALYKSSISKKPLTTSDAFNEAARLRTDAASYWLSRLAGLSFDDIEAIFNNIPSGSMSDLAREFAMKMLKINLERLLTRGV